MKKQLFSLLLIAFLAVQCQTKKATESTTKTDSTTTEKETTKTETMPQKETKMNRNKNLNRIWILVKFENFDEKKLKQMEASLDFSKTENATANMGCNTLNFSYKTQNNSKISFSDVSSTKMMCLDITLENEFKNKLNTFTTYKIENHKLTLTNDKKQEMVFIAQDWD